MQPELSLFARVRRERVIALLRATGSHDPDELRDRMRGLLARVRIQQRTGISCLLGAVALHLAWPTSRLGIPLAAAGIWLWIRGARNGATVEAAYSEFVKNPGG